MTLTILIVLTLAGPALVYAAHRIRDDDVSDWVGIIGVSVIFIAVFGWLMFGLRGLIHAADADACAEFGAAAGYETRMVDYHTWAWECLVNVDGVWAPKDALRIEDL